MALNPDDTWAWLLTLDGPTVAELDEIYNGAGPGSEDFDIEADEQSFVCLCLRVPYGTSSVHLVYD